jgi:cytoplasmic iron level regulating protein YaaA (DUF328/UPF0246 family)
MPSSPTVWRWASNSKRAAGQAAAAHGSPAVVNLASQEYFGAVDVGALKIPVMTCHFKEEKDGEMRVLSFYAKKARGLMARYAIDHRIDQADGLKAFNTAGYRFHPAHSTAQDWVFSRPQVALVSRQAAA